MKRQMPGTKTLEVTPGPYDSWPPTCKEAKTLINWERETLRQIKHLENFQGCPSEFDKLRFKIKQRVFRLELKWSRWVNAFHADKLHEKLQSVYETQLPRVSAEYDRSFRDRIREYEIEARQYRYERDKQLGW